MPITPKGYVLKFREQDLYVVLGYPSTTRVAFGGATIFRTQFDARDHAISRKLISEVELVPVFLGETVPW